MPKEIEDQDEDLENEDLETEDQDEGADEGEEPEEGGEGGEGEEDEGEGRGQSARVPGRSRATDRVLKFREEARSERQRADDLQRQLYQLQGTVDGLSRQTDEVRQREQWEQMSPEERVDYSLRQARQEQAQFMQHQQFATQDNNDRVAFKAMCDPVPEYAKMAPQVEHELGVIRRQYGWNAPRQLVLATLLGMQVMNSRQEVSQQRAAGKQRINSQKARISGGSDKPARRGPPAANSPEARRKRLENSVF